MVSIRYILLLGLILSLFIPVSATDLTGYDGYITAKFGASVFGDYIYRSNYIDWKPQVPSFESNGGYYDIYDIGEKINFYIHINTTKSGQLYLFIYYYDGGVLQQEKYLVEDLSSYNQWVSYEIEIKNNWEGNIYSQWSLYSSSQWYSSYEYLFFSKYALNSDWKYEKIIDISSTEKLKDGIAQIIINDSEFYEHSNIIYVVDNKENNYVGTLTDMIFVNLDQTKAYPYFINKYKGGYYEFNQNTTNNTIIDLWINEDLNDISLKMFYGFNPVKYAYPYIFGRTNSIFGDTRGDRPNNPFTVHQVFSDWRWDNLSINNLGSISYSNLYSYNRGNYIQADYVHPDDPYIYFTPKYFNNVSQIYLNLDFHSNYGSPFLSSSWNIAYHSAPDFILKNSTGSLNSLLTTQGKFKFYLENNNLSVEKNDVLYSNISESKIKFDNFNIIGGRTYATSSQYSRLENFYELPNNTITYSVSNASATKYALINFIYLFEIDTYLNNIYVGGIFETDTAGTFLCSDVNNNTVDYIDIPEPLGTTSYNIIFPYLIKNQTEFLNISNFTYYCKYVADNGFIEQSENRTITFLNNKIYLSDVKPIYQNNYSYEYVLTSITSNLNYTGVDTHFIHYIYKINCELLNEDGKCLNYETGTATLFLNNSINDISTSYIYSNIYQLDQNSWYYSFYVYGTNETYARTPSYIFYVQAKEEALISFPVEDFLDWNDTDLTDNKEFMSDKFWDNPLNWMSSLVYQKFIITQITDEKTLVIFKYSFLIFWSFWFVLLVIGLGVVYEFRENSNVLKIAGFGVMPFMFFFSYLGWLGIDIISLVVLLICIYIVYLWSRR